MILVDSGKDDGKSMENSTSDPAPFTIRLFGLGNPGTGFYHLVPCRAGGTGRG